MAHGSEDRLDGWDGRRGPIGVATIPVPSRAEPDPHRSSHRRAPRRRPPRAPVVVGLCLAAVVLGVTLVGPTANVPRRTPPGTSAAAAVAARVGPGLVDIDTRLAFDQGSSAGTGMVVGSSGVVVTNNHVIEDETSLAVTDVGNGRTYRASVVGYDVGDDVALLRLRGASGLRTVRFARAAARLGQPVVTVGNAWGAGGKPAGSAGTVTALHQSITAVLALTGSVEHLTGLVETDAALESGDSGGPLTTRQGTVLGMDTASKGGSNAAGWTARSYAVTTATVRRVAGTLAAGRPAAGLHVGPTASLGARVVTLGTGGALMVQVEPGSPAAAAGIVPGDVIVSLAGRPVRTATALGSLLLGERPGTSVVVGWQDPRGTAHEAPVTLVGGPPA